MKKPQRIHNKQSPKILQVKRAIIRTITMAISHICFRNVCASTCEHTSEYVWRQATPHFHLNDVYFCWHRKKCGRMCKLTTRVTSGKAGDLIYTIPYFLS